jgi:membrane-associated phospholipid phosphatase
VRSAEWIGMAFFSLFCAAAMWVPDGSKRLKAMGIGLVGIGVTASLPLLDRLPMGDVVRDVVPGFLLLLCYWQSGQFFARSNPKVQAGLRAIDARWFPGVMRLSSRLDARPILAAYLETAYLMCYPMVPLGIAALYVLGHQDAADRFWTVVLTPTLICYGLTVLLQSLPPRLADGEHGGCFGRSNVRSVNLWVLRHAGVRANTLPSGHVTSSLAIALVLLQAAPLAGVVFLWTAVSIAVATAVLRYHYSIDAVLGIALALLSFFVLG